MGRVREATGIVIETISTKEEARLAVNGCAPLLDPAVPHAIVFDIGGGSTELIWLRLPAEPTREPEILGVVSLPFGVVTFTERYGGDAISADEYEAMIGEAKAAMVAFARQHGIAEVVAGGGVQMLGSSGTVTTLAGIRLGLPRYNRNLVDGTTLSFDEIHAVSAELAAADFAARAAHPCIGNERADLVVAGCAILEAICRLWPVGRLRVADRGVREGILFDLLAAR
jgi:exopolyphosphatase/guanosine-5'-triphosphate,3'-diphosphate pyrophosphatase